MLADTERDGLMGMRRGWRWRQRKRNSKAKTIAQRPSSKPKTTCAFIDDRQHWFVAYVRPMSEKSVARKLESDGLTPRRIITYLPLIGYSIDKQLRGRRYTVEIERPLFASYLFIGMESPELQFAAVREMDGVIDLLSDEDERPIEIPGGLLRGIERELAGPVSVRPPSSFTVGCLIRIKDGALASFVAIIAEIVSETHVRALVNAFGRQTLAQLEISQLEAA